MWIIVLFLLDLSFMRRSLDSCGGTFCLLRFYFFAGLLDAMRDLYG